MSDGIGYDAQEIDSAIRSLPDCQIKRLLIGQRSEIESLRARCIELEKDMAIFAGTARVIGDACDRAGIQAGGYLGDRVAVLASTLLHQQGVTKAMSDLSVRLERERDALAAQVAHLPEGARVERDFDFDMDAQEHIPKITIYLPRIPAFGGLQQSWEQRDKIAAVLAAAQQNREKGQ